MIGITRTLCCLLTLFALSACGTAHYFTPARPLGKGEWELSFVWHYDLSRVDPPISLVFPDINAWTGRGEETNLGFGTSGLWPSHFSLAHYWPKSDDANFVLYGHIKPLNPNRNPWLEIGGAWGVQKSDTRSMVGVGLGMVITRAWLLSPTTDTSIHSRGGGHWPLPIISYSAGGSSVGFSWRWTPGATRRMVTGSFPGLSAAPDTLYYFAAADIDLVTITPQDTGFVPTNVQFAVWTNGEPHYFFANRRHPDSFAPSYGTRMSSWVGYRFVDFQLCSGSDGWPCSRSGGFIGDLQEMEKWDGKSDIVILRYPATLAEALKKVNWFSKDHAFGFTILAHPK